MRDKIYIIGLTIIILTFIVSLNPYILIFTAPVFLLGVGLLWFSKARLLAKTLFTFLPIILWYPSFYIFMYLTGTIGTATAQKLDFNFHEDFKGKAIVVQEINCGQEVEIVKGREQLNFPENGILLNKGKIESGYINHKYYRVTSSGEKITVPGRANYMFWDDADTEISTSEIGVWLEGMGMATQFPPGGLGDYEFLELIIASKDSLEKYQDFLYNKKVDSVKYQMMESCK
ncbi:hypothetical protein AAE02nite_43700 [Adhaeribacter aerolatus]|uniref:DUF6843 domain-containing protein n=1 Tax=Adhaeribacter aerolatus TaxID=670289 RepID=A0A512B409_9BACT|nr:hypothetical protein [Adhaeribacter aerolatus]GEO06706.1 hypothetical protein AAE02nite_43700 [Adhaeribacter aerolatus]